MKKKETAMLAFTSIKFTNYKTFKTYSVSLKSFNILVGPNNAGKSTIIGAFKILSEGIKKAKSRKAELIDAPSGIQVHGYQIEIADIPIATENAFHNYNIDEPAVAKFRLSNGSHLQIFFPANQSGCYMNCIHPSEIIRSPKDFNKHFDLSIGFVPILGPVEHEEVLYQKEAARKALNTYKASRNFRNIWYHYPDDFDEFKQLLATTWPGMEINKPEANFSGKTNKLYMFCPEDRIPRELFWAGYGFQVWCQMLTYIIKNKTSSIFIIDEPDIYLHSDLQRQLISILKILGPDIIIATHSTELISEADINDILVINKTRKSAKRITNPAELQSIFNVLGSNLNPILTQVAKTKRVLFVEGKDFQILSKFARTLNYHQVANRSNFAVIPVEGFNPQKLRAFKEGIEKTIGDKIKSAVIFDKDYKSADEISQELKNLSKGQEFAHIHSCKEIENFLINPRAIEQSIRTRLSEKNRRTGENLEFNEDIHEVIKEISDEFKSYVFGQLQAKQFDYAKRANPTKDASTINEFIYESFNSDWLDINKRIKMIPGKEFLTKLNQYLQEKYKISLTKQTIANNIAIDDFDNEMKLIIKNIDDFRK